MRSRRISYGATRTHSMNSRSEPGPRRLGMRTVVVIHEMLLAEHCGVEGVRDVELLDDSLSSIRFQYLGGPADILNVAAATAHALLRNRPFNDANKRLALSLSGVFLELNGLRLIATEPDTVLAIAALEDGTLSESDFAKWLRISCQNYRRPPSTTPL